jgi:phospholipid/cholesterol/gamma-HCH transport system permease protein
MIAAADFDTDQTDGGLIVRFTGRLTLARIADLPERLNALREEQGAIRRFDLSQVERVDTVGAWLVQRIAREDEAEVVGATPEAAILLAAVEEADQPVTIRPDRRSPIERMVAQLGAATITAIREFGGIIAFLGATLVALFRVARNPRRLRGHSIITHFETVGVSALGIIGLMLFLIGIVIAQQGAVQLKQFGLEVFTINLVGRSSIRELGLLMTAIMIAGRSGSAFAAQIGTMNLTEEVDAMRTIGVSPMEALVVPRVIAAVLMMPLLGFYAAICAIAGGGLFCWIGLEIPPLTYVQLLQDIIPMTDFWAMLIKAPVFGVIVAVTGCYEGMQVRDNAAEVGLRTTAAVVQGIFLVIVLDAFFAVFFSGLGWN